MAGVNQTILMCLSMVVIAALIGARGLGSVVLEALPCAASGQGLLAGIAILLCAIVIDRIVQGMFGSDEPCALGAAKTVARVAVDSVQRLAFLQATQLKASEDQRSRGRSRPTGQRRVSGSGGS
jgi:hypothetical protein